MNGKRPFFILSALLFSLVSSVAGKTTTLSIEQAVSLAQESNLSLLLLREQVVLEQSKIPGANRRHNPEFGIGYRSDLLFENEGAYILEVEASQEIELGGQGDIRRQLVNAAIERAQLSVRLAEEQVKQQVVIAYFSTRIAQDRSAFLESIEVATKQLRDTAQLRADQQVILRSDFQFLNLDYLSARSARELALAKFEEKAADLARLMGIATDSLNLTDSVSLGGLRQLIPSEQALVASDSLLSLQWQSLREQQALGLMLQERERIPNLTVGLMYEYGKTVSTASPSGENTGAFESTLLSDNLFGLKLSIPIPFFERNKGGIAVARARQNTLEERLRLQAIQRSRLIETSLHLRNSSLTAIETLAPVVSETSELLALLTDAYRGGRITIDRYLNQKSQLQQFREAYFNSLEQFVTLANELQAQLAEQKHVVDVE